MAIDEFQDFQETQLDEILKRGGKGPRASVFRPRLQTDSNSCVGCLHKAGRGEEAWCKNPKLAMNERPYGPSMKGCKFFELSSPDAVRKVKEESMAKGLARIAARARTDDR